VRHDDLRRLIDCGLRVVALNLTTILGLQDAALRLAGLLAASFLALLFRLFSASHLFCGGGTVNVVLPENLAADMAAKRAGSRPMWRSCRSWCLGANRN